MKPEEKFNLLKDRYIQAYRDCNGKDVVSLEYCDGYVCIGVENKNSDWIKERKFKVHQFEKMTINLEERLRNKI